MTVFERSSQKPQPMLHPNSGIPFTPKFQVLSQTAGIGIAFMQGMQKARSDEHEPRPPLTCRLISFDLPPVHVNNTSKDTFQPTGIC